MQLVRIMDEYDKKNGKKIFRLAEISALLQTSPQSAGMLLLRAMKSEIVFRVKSYWINQRNPPTLEELALTLRLPSYISFESALYQHGILSQAPQGALTLATIKRPEKINTPLGTIQYIHIKQDIFFGYDKNRLATAEKAWLDLLYIRSLRNRNPVLFETFYPEELNGKLIHKLIGSFPDRVMNWDRQIRFNK